MNIEKVRAFKEKFPEGDVLGCFSKTTDSAMVETMGLAGMDYVILDMEHGPISIETLEHHLRACDKTDMLGIVRVDSPESKLIGKALDVGAHGIQVPSVNSAEQARIAIEKARFSPLGSRGVCRFVRAAEYTRKDRTEYFSESNELILILQLEGKEGIASFDEIIKLPGIDVIFLGPYDLSQSMGVPGQIEHPSVVAEMNRIIGRAKEKGIYIGTFCDTPEQLKSWREKGVKYLSYSVDVGLFYDKMTELRKW